MKEKRPRAFRENAFFSSSLHVRLFSLAPQRYIPLTPSSCPGASGCDARNSPRTMSSIGYRTNRSVMLPRRPSGPTLSRVHSSIFSKESSSTNLLGGVRVWSSIHSRTSPGSMSPPATPGGCGTTRSTTAPVATPVRWNSAGEQGRRARKRETRERARTDAKERTKKKKPLEATEKERGEATTPRLELRVPVRRREVLRREAEMVADRARQRDRDLVRRARVRARPRARDVPVRARRRRRRPRRRTRTRAADDDDAAARRRRRRREEGGGRRRRGGGRERHRVVHCGGRGEARGARRRRRRKRARRCRDGVVGTPYLSSSVLAPKSIHVGTSRGAASRRGCLTPARPRSAARRRSPPPFAVDADARRRRRRRRRARAADPGARRATRTRTTR